MGSYNIVPTATGTNIGNYTVTPVDGTLTIAPATLTVTASDATRSYGAANPTFSGTVSGAMNGDTFTVLGTSLATVTSGVGSYPITPFAAGTNIGNYTVTPVNGTLSISKAATTTTLGLSSSTPSAGTSVTVTAQVASSTSGTPTGTLSFYNGSSLLSSVGLTGGAASYTTTSLDSGAASSLNAVYSGDTDFNTSSSATTTVEPVLPLDFQLNPGSGTTQSVVPGAAATYSIGIAPINGAYPGAVIFSVSGLPFGVSAIFSPSSIAANAGAQTVSLKVQTSTTVALHRAPSIDRRMAPTVLALLLFPLFGARCRRLRGRLVRPFLWLLLFGGMATTLLTGCGSGSLASIPSSYPLTITAISGTVQHSTIVTLTEQ